MRRTDPLRWLLRFRPRQRCTTSTLRPGSALRNRWLPRRTAIIGFGRSTYATDLLDAWGFASNVERLRAGVIPLVCRRR